MPFQPASVTYEQLELTCERLRMTFACAIFRRAGIASLEGHSCLLNVPTGAGKTAAALYALFSLSPLVTG